MRAWSLLSGLVLLLLVLLDRSERLLFISKVVIIKLLCHDFFFNFKNGPKKIVNI